MSARRSRAAFCNSDSPGEIRYARSQLRGGDGLPGWAYRTAEIHPRATQLDCVTISPEVGVSPAAETLRVRAALCGFAAPAKIQQAILAHEQVALELGSSRTRLRLDAAIGPARPRRATLMVRTLRDARLDTREARPRFRYPSQPSTGRGQTRRHQPANRR